MEADRTANALAVLARVAKAIVAGAAAGAAYLIGVLSPDATFGDVTLVQWLGIIPVIAAAYGITWRVPNGT